MKKEQHQQLLSQAIQIAEDLIAKAKRDAKGLYWETMTMDNTRKIDWVVAESIYCGVAGIALFFLELYKHTNRKKYFSTATSAFNWLENTAKEKEDRPATYAFFTGQMSVSYAFLKLYDLTKDKKHLQTASALAKNCDDFLKFPIQIDDLINGTSGALLGLLHLHSYTNEQWIADKINLFIEHLLKHANFGKKGIYWDRSHHQICGLCGFSHGAAGIGYVFLELGNYFSNPAFYHVAELAFVYENQHYRSKWKNWPDLRRGYFTEDDFKNAKEKFFENDRSYFTQGSDMNAWCHGAAGVGLSRLRAYELLRNNKYLKDAGNALAKTKTTEFSPRYAMPNISYTLCHGAGGNTDLFIQAGLKWKEKKYLTLAEKVAQKALAAYATNKFWYSGYATGGEKEDTSLFMGNAGVGYFLLRVLDPVLTPSILAPDVKQPVQPVTFDKEYDYIQLSDEKIKRVFLQKYYLRTLQIMEKILPEITARFIRESHFDNLFTNFEKLVSTKSKKLKSSEKSVVTDIFRLERKRKQIDRTITSAAYLFIKQRIGEEQAQSQLEKNKTLPGNLSLKLSDDLHLLIQKYNWMNGSNDQNIGKPASAHPLILRSFPGGVIEEDLSPFSYTVLHSFGKGNSVDRVIKEMIAAFEPSGAEEEQQVREAVQAQITHAFAGGILVKES